LLRRLRAHLGTQALDFAHLLVEIHAPAPSHWLQILSAARR
jgi:hypothetical protein